MYGEKNAAKLFYISYNTSIIAEQIKILMTMAEEQFSLIWNSFPANLSTGLYSIFTDQHLVDVTLAAEGKILGAHKLILSVCSTYFRDLFKVIILFTTLYNC